MGSDMAALSEKVKLTFALQDTFKAFRYDSLVSLIPPSLVGNSLTGAPLELFLVVRLFRGVSGGQNRWARCQSGKSKPASELFFFLECIQIFKQRFDFHLKHAMPLACQRSTMALNVSFFFCKMAVQKCVSTPKLFPSE